MYGEYVMTLPAPEDFNPYASCSGTCSTSSYLSAFFNTSISNSYAWEFYYGHFVIERGLRSMT